MAKEKKRTDNKQVQSVKSKKKISVQLLAILVPMIGIFIVVAAFTVFFVSRNIIIEQAQNSLQNESNANANDIGSRILEMQGYFEAVADVLETVSFKDDNEMVDKMQVLREQFEETPNAFYIGLSNKQFIDDSLWVPDEDYDPTTRDWYANGINAEKLTFGAPYIDMSTEQMCSSMGRKITLPDGRDGVYAVDVFLAKVSEEVAQYTPGGTGHAMLFDKSVILASTDAEQNGKDVSEITDDPFITQVGALVENGASGVVTLKSGSSDIYVACSAVPGTEWTMVSFVPKSDVLAKLNILSIVTIILVVIMLIVSTLIIMALIRGKITKPVTALTNTITRIADGDFTVKIAKGGQNEIGVMNDRMHDYVERMRGTLGDMKDVTKLLSEEAENSKNASDALNQQATEQSNSMEQIHNAMEGVASSVTDLATNATELAQAVSDMTEQGNATNEVMVDLLEKAKQGQRDMENVQNNMNNISTSMSEMSEVVGRVGHATEEINSIIDMINSISSQTNLLSLNASIEAARAGEAGKGFAVVADEIGELANESAKATTEIGNIITEVTKEIENLSERSDTSVDQIAASSDAVSATGATFAEIFEALDETGQTVKEMIGQMETVNDIATNVAAIAEEQSASTEEVTATVDTASTSAQSVAAESKGVDESAITVADSADKISSFVDTFTI